MRWFGGKRKYSQIRNQTKTANYTVLTGDLGTRFNNQGAAAGIVFTLPSAPPSGLRYEFFCATAFPMVITAGSADGMYVEGVKQADASSIMLWQVGHRAILVSDGNGDWLVEQSLPHGRDRQRYVKNWEKHPGLNADIQNSAEAVRMIVDPDFEILGVNGTSALATIHPEGGLLLTTAGAADDQMIVLPHLDTSQTGLTATTWGTDRVVDWKARLITGASVTNYLIWAGLKLTNTPVVATDNDQVFFRLEDDVSSGLIRIASSIANVDTDTNTAITGALSTQYDLWINIDAARVARCFLNGVLKLTTAALTDATDFIPYVGIENDGGAGAAKTLRILDGYEISRKVG